MGKPVLWRAQLTTAFIVAFGSAKVALPSPASNGGIPVGQNTTEEPTVELMKSDGGRIPPVITRFFLASTELMQVMARACGHDHLNQFNIGDLTSWKKEMAELAGIPFAGPATTHSFA